MRYSTKWRQSYRYQIKEQVGGFFRHIHKKIILGTNYDPGVQLVPSASADTKLVLKLLGILNFFKYAQNDFGILKSETLVQKLVNLSILQTF